MVEEGTTRGGAKGLGQWLARIAPKRARGSVTVAILSDTRVRALNRKYRGKDEPTDVLSFPAQTAREGSRSHFWAISLFPAELPKNSQNCSDIP